MENQEEQKEQSPDKLKKNFDAKVKLLSEFLGGEKNLLPSNKVERTEFEVIVDELVKEEKEKNKAEIKAKLGTLLGGYQTLKREISNKKKELEKLEADKMKQFIKDADDLFNRVVVMKEKQADYTEGLNEATKG